jgi:hypothetical protein
MARRPPDSVTALRRALTELQLKTEAKSGIDLRESSDHEGS